ncbi:MAG: HEPN domain-containing protein [Nitrospinae bacterium]|nr:HEPN domain-containing protein [Nitrospinota bacterium]
MSKRDDIHAVGAEWVKKAENDLTAASHTLTLGEKCPTDAVCFHVQQCVEKYLKAVLVLEEIPFPKTHDIEEIVLLLPLPLRPTLTKDEQGFLTEYATGPRYPGWGEVSLTEARRAVALARRVRKEIRAKLPKEVLRRRSVKEE